MHFAYLLRSVSDPTVLYVGYSSDLKSRIAVHNSGGSLHTARLKPWTLEFYAAFRTEERARAFETYLKSHSGLLFARKHLHSIGDRPQ